MRIVKYKKNGRYLLREYAEHTTDEYIRSDLGREFVESQVQQSVVLDEVVITKNGKGISFTINEGYYGDLCLISSKTFRKICFVLSEFCVDEGYLFFKSMERSEVVDVREMFLRNTSSFLEISEIQESLLFGWFFKINMSKYPVITDGVLIYINDEQYSLEKRGDVFFTLVDGVTPSFIIIGENEDGTWYINNNGDVIHSKNSDPDFTKLDWGDTKVEIA